MRVQELAAACDAGVKCLIARQHDDGHWEDYRLPVGSSDAWVTAYVALRLLAAAAVVRTGDPVRAAAQAAAWLRRTRPYPAGWGFNGTTGPDADSTAHALMLLRRFGGRRRADLAWLLTCWRDCGGFATFDTSDGWGDVHACVTPLAFLALPDSERTSRRPAVMRYLTDMRRPDGTWSAYWWRTRCYSTYWNLHLCGTLGLETPPVLCRFGDDEGFSAHSTFDLAFVVAIAGLEACGGAAELATLLASRQCRDGSWTGGEDLRVTRHDCVSPHSLQGQLYRDVNGLITTASAIFALSQIVRAADHEHVARPPV